jgi:sulfatase maturation enzyme AslB (radical SAM superfamily)
MTKEVFANLAARMPRRIDQPFSSNHLKFLITNRCSLQCKYCYNYFTKYFQDLDVELAISFLKDYFKFNRPEAHQELHSIKQITFTGGEPSMNLLFIEKVVQYLDGSGVHYLPLIMTNGVMSPQALKTLINLRMGFQISFDGLTGENRVTSYGENAVPKIVATIEKVRVAGLPVFLKSTITQSNVTEMENIIIFAAEHGVESVYFSALCFLGNAGDNAIARATLAEFKDNMQKAFAKADALGVRLYSVEHSRIRDILRFAGKNVTPVEIAPFILLADGCVAFSTAHTIGSIDEAKVGIIGKYTKEDGLILDNDRIAQLMSNFLHNQEKHCLNCAYFRYCRGLNKNFSDLLLKQNLAQLDYYVCALTKMKVDMILSTLNIFPLACHEGN